MGIISGLKSAASKVTGAVSSAYKKVDTVVGGKLPGGVTSTSKEPTPTIQYSAPIGPTQSGSSGSGSPSGSSSGVSGGSTTISGGEYYNPVTGEGMSIAPGGSVPTGYAPVTPFNKPSPSSSGVVSSRSSSGVYQGPLPQGTTTQQEQTFRQTGFTANKQNLLSQDIPSSYVTEKSYVQGLKDIPTYFKETFKRDGGYRAVKGSAEILTGSIVRGLTSVEKPVIGATEYVLRKGGIAESPAVELQKEKSQKETDVNTFNREAERYAKDVESFNNKWGNKEITTQDELNKYNAEKKNLEIKQKNLALKEQVLVKDLEELDKKEKQIEKSPRTFAKTLFNSIAVGAITLPFEVVKFGANFVSSPIQTTIDVGEGIKSIPSAVAQRPASTIGEITGSLIGASIFSAGITKVANLKNLSKINEAKNIALRSSSEIKNIKGITSESEILKLSIPEAEKAKLLGRLNAGESIRIVEYELKAPSSYEQAILNKYSPVKSIRVVEKVDSFGNIIEQTAIGEIKIGGKVDYIENIYSKGYGIKSGELTRVESISLGVGEKGITSATRTSQIIEGQLKRFGRDRYLFGESKVAETTIEGTTKKPLNFEDLKKLSDKKLKDYTLKTNKQLQTEKLYSIRELEVSTPETTYLGLEKKYKITGAVNEEKIVPKAIEYEKIIDKSIKPFEETINIKEIKSPEVNLGSSKVLQEITEEINLNNIPLVDISSQVKSAVKSTIGKNNFQQEILIPSVKFGEKNIITKELNEITNALSSPNIIIKEKEKIKETPIIEEFISYKPQIKIDEKVENLILSDIKIKSPQISEVGKVQELSVTPPSLRYPEINIPKFPPVFTLPSKGQGSGYINIKRLTKQPKKIKQKYAASLASAAFQIKPTKVTKKQYEQLTKRTSYGELRPIVEIVPEEELKKVVKKEVKF